MTKTNIVALPVAVRVYPAPAKAKNTTRSERPWQLPDAMLIFGTETRTDPAQRLTFGSYRYFVEGQCLEEGLFYGYDLPEKDCHVLERYVAAHRKATRLSSCSATLLATR